MKYLKLFENYEPFIRINDIDGLLSNLEKHRDSDIVLHYRCSNCGDEQVTNSISVDDTIIDSFKKEDCLYAGLECTNCGHTDNGIYTDAIFGAEVLEK